MLGFTVQDLGFTALKLHGLEWVKTRGFRVLAYGTQS